MSNLPADLDFVINKSASPTRMNAAMTNINDRLAALETYKPNFDALYDQLQAIGLSRISDAIAPVYAALIAVSDLGSVFTTGSGTVVLVEIGRKVFQVRAADRPTFAPSGYMIALSTADSRNAMMGRIAGYDRTSGYLLMDVAVATGTGSYSDWQIMPTVPPLVVSSGIDGGSDDAPNLMAVPYVATNDFTTTVLDYDNGVDGVNPTIPGVLIDAGTA